MVNKVDLFSYGVANVHIWHILNTFIKLLKASL